MSYELVDHTKELKDRGDIRYNPWETVAIVVHRIWFDDWSLADLPHKTALDIAKRFTTDSSLGTGLHIPYHVIIDTMGVAHQMLKETEKGAHSYGWNGRTLGVACMGDTRKQPLTQRQELTLAELCADLCQAHDLNPLDTLDYGSDNGASQEVFALCGHDELPGGSRDVDKRCPGQYLSMDGLRREVNDVIVARAQMGLLRNGWVL